MPSWSLQNSRKAQRIIYYSLCDDSECKSFHYNICVECVAVRNKKAGFVVAYLYAAWSSLQSVVVYVGRNSSLLSVLLGLVLTRVFFLGGSFSVG